MTVDGGYSSVRVWGESGLHPSTFRRRIVRLENAGLIRRSIRTGGPGGTQSVILYRGTFIQLLDLVRAVPRDDRKVCRTCGRNVPKAMWVETIREVVRRELRRPPFPPRDSRPFGEAAQ